MLKFCKKCGASLPEQKTFCSKCGTALQGVNTPGIPPVGVQAQMPNVTAQPVMPHMQMPHPAGTNKSNIFKAVSIGGVAVIVVLVGFIAINFFGIDDTHQPDTLVTAPDATADQSAVQEPPAGQEIDSRLFGVWELREDDYGLLVVFFSSLFGFWADSTGDMVSFDWTVSNNSLVIVVEGEEERTSFNIISSNTILLDGEYFTRIDSAVHVDISLYGEWVNEHDDALLVFNRHQSGMLEDWISGETQTFGWSTINDVLVLSAYFGRVWHTFNVIDQNTIKWLDELWFRR